MIERMKKVAEFKTRTTVDLADLKKKVDVLYNHFEKDDQALVKSIMASSMQESKNERKYTAASTVRPQIYTESHSTPF